MEEQLSRVYALINENNIITCIEGEYTLPADLTGWTFIEEGAPCDRLNLAQSHYLNKPLMTDDGIYQYKYEDGQIVERTAEEIEADREAVPVIPTKMELLEAQVFYTAAMTDTLLEE